MKAKQWLQKSIQIAKQNDVQLKTEIIDSQMSIEAAIVEYAESHGVDLIIIGTKRKIRLQKDVAWKCCIGSSYLRNMSCNGSKIILNNVTVGTALLPYA